MGLLKDQSISPCQVWTQWFIVAHNRSVTTVQHDRYRLNFYHGWIQSFILFIYFYNSWTTFNHAWHVDSLSKFDYGSKILTKEKSYQAISGWLVGRTGRGNNFTGMLLGLTNWSLPLASLLMWASPARVSPGGLSVSNRYTMHDGDDAYT